MHNLVLVAVMLSACTSGVTDLASLTQRVVGITATDRDSIIVDLTFDGITSVVDHNCATLAVNASINGVPFQRAEQGHWTGPTLGGNQGYCTFPNFWTNAIPPGPTTIEIADPTATISITLPDLSFARSMDLTPTPSFHSGDTLAIRFASAPTDQVASVEISATTPKAMVPDPQTQGYCGNEMFFTSVKPNGNSATFAVPDVYAKWMQTGCDYVLTKGQSAPVNFDLKLAVYPQISRCEGADCNAIHTTASKATGTYVP